MSDDLVAERRLRTARDHVPNASSGHSVSRLVPAPAGRVWRALHTVRLRDLPLTATLLAVRTLPARVRRSPSGRTSAALDEPLLDLMTRSGFVLLYTEREAIVTLGVVGRFWELGGGRDMGITDARRFVEFAEPGFVRSAIDFRLQTVDGGTLVHTDTWNAATDARTAETFARYWRLVRSGSKLIRGEMLRVIARLA